MTNPGASVNTGILGEDLVAQWLEGEGWEILERRWRCRWGELDIIAKKKTISDSSSGLLVFVEVKTRRRGNWDADGLLSITESKQQKLWQAAEMFLSDRPELADYPCRFDVALVRCNATKKKSSSSSPDKPNDRASTIKVDLGHPVEIAGYQLVLQEYISCSI